MEKIFKYSYTLEDFQSYYNQKNKLSTFRKVFLILTFCLGVFFLVLSIILGIFMKLLFPVVTLLLIPVIVPILQKAMMNFFAKTSFKKTIKLVEEVECKITEERIEAASTFGSNSLPYEKFVKVIETNNRYFFMLNSVQFLMIRQSDLGNEFNIQFKEFLNQKLTTKQNKLK